MKKFILILTCCVLISGCATVKTGISPEMLKSIDKIVIDSVVENENLIVLDHTGTWDKTYTGGQFGAIGGALEGIILGIQAKIKIKKSLGGTSEELEMMVGAYPIDDLVDDELNGRVQVDFEVVNIDVIGGFNKERKIKDAISLCNENGADIYIKLNYVYGIAAYNDSPSSATIDADLAIYDVHSKKALLKKKISSDELFKAERYVDEFLENDAEYFKSDIEKAVRALALLVSSDFGLNSEEVAELKGINPLELDAEAVSGISASCKKPYHLTQDCSWTVGAKRKIDISGQKASIAGSEDGHVVLVMGYKVTGDVKGEKLRRAFNEIVIYLESKDINIIKLKKMELMNAPYGYYLELDGDGYSLLKKLSIDK